MPATYTSSLKLTLPSDGDTNWGTLVNNGVTTLIDASIAGVASIALVGATDRTLSDYNGIDDEARKMFVNVTGTPGAPTNIICPAVPKLYFVSNATSPGFAITLKTSAGTGISVPSGAKMVLYCNGTNVLDAVTQMSSLALTAALAATSGGTGLSSVGTTGNVLVSNGTTWTSAATPPAGSTTQVQYNNAGVLAGSANLTFDGTNLLAAGLRSTNPVLIGGPTTTGFFQGLQLYGNSLNGPQNSFQWSYGSGDNPATAYLLRSRASTATGNTAVAFPDVLGGYGFGGTDGTNTIGGLPNVLANANVVGIVDGAVSAGVIPTALRFYTGSTGSNSRMVITSTGVVSMLVYGAGTATFSAGGVISSVSDETYKIKDGVIADPIPMLMALKPGYYFGKPEANMGPGRQLGFYAQNVREAIGPEAAPDPKSSTAEDGTVTTRPWGYFDRSVLAVAVDALKVQQAQIIALTARIAALEAK